MTVSRVKTRGVDEHRRKPSDKTHDVMNITSWHDTIFAQIFCFLLYFSKLRTMNIKIVFIKSDVLSELAFNENRLDRPRYVNGFLDVSAQPSSKFDDEK